MATGSENRRVKEPIHAISSQEDMVKLFTSMGVQKGMLVLVQGDLRKLGYICGGAQGVVEALMKAVSYEGTIVMPAFSETLVDPSCLTKQMIERDSWDYVRMNSLPFDHKTTVEGLKDTLALQLMRNAGVCRSSHPLHSFMAYGKYAKILCEKHPLHFSLSKDSPLGRLYDMNAFVLNLGVSYRDSVAFHLAHYYNEKQPIHVTCAPVAKNAKLVWKDMLDVHYDTSKYETIGEIMEDRSIVKFGYLNHGLCRFYSLREAVNIANAYFHIQ